MLDFAPVYVMYVAMMVISLFGIIVSKNLLKKLIMLAILQTNVIFFFISIGYKTGKSSPFYKAEIFEYVNPLPQVLMLTAIVVGISLVSIGLALLIKISEKYNSIQEDEIEKIEKSKNEEMSSL